jgi:hypothetical protein
MCLVVKSPPTCRVLVRMEGEAGEWLTYGIVGLFAVYDVGYVSWESISSTLGLSFVIDAF